MPTIRRLTPEDLPLLHPLEDAILAGEEALLRIGRSGFTISYMPLPRAEWRVFPPDPLASPEYILHKSHWALFAAFDGDNLIGLASVRLNDTNWADVADIRVDAAWRRKSVARHLLDTCDQFAHDNGMYGLRVVCTDSNPAMCQFCTHCGFTLGGFDNKALAYSDQERQKPLARRASLLFFYRAYSSMNQLRRANAPTAAPNTER